MRIRELLLTALVWITPTLAAGQQGPSFRTVELRLTTVVEGRKVFVDRGATDRLEVGDVVRFMPRDSGSYGGLIIEVLERTALVEVHNPRALPVPGTRGEVHVPGSRFAAPAPTTPPALVEGESPGAAPPLTEVAADGEASPEHPPWEREDDWAPGDPLLAKVEALRPEQREPTFSGRLYVSADQMAATQDNRSDGFYRVGTDLLYGNLFGRGGELHLDGEWNYRDTSLPGNNDESEANLRIDRASYSWGGTRYSPVRHEVGRFLHKGMPEFGVLDGYEWIGRASTGARMGYSLGFMPEPDKDMQSGNDFEFSAFYNWVADETERVSTSVGFQKTLHNASADRDLLIAKFHVLPEEGWTWMGNAWIDYYTSGDAIKGSGLELTQAFLNASKLWEDGHRIDVTYSHLAIPDIERFEFLQPDATTLEEARTDRLAVDSSRPWGDKRFHTGIGAWIDQEDEGGDAQVGLEYANWLLDRSRTDVTLFATYGRFASMYGARIDYGWLASSGSWDVLFEIAQTDQFGFSSNNDNLLQQRYRVMRQFRTESGWDFAAHVQGTILEDEEGLALGFYLQRSF